MSDRFLIEFTDRAKKDVKDLRQHQDQVLRKILRLQEDPLAGYALKGALQGARALEFNLKGGGAYRAV